MELKIQKDYKLLLLDYFWLRDHCRCSMCFNKDTHQRNAVLLNIPLDIRPIKYVLSDDILAIKWSDGHDSDYKLSWLINFCSTQNQLDGLQSLYKARKLWEENVPPAIPTVSHQDVLNGRGTYHISDALLKYGFVTINQVPPTLKDTERISTAIGLIQHTFFGSMWQFGSDLSIDKHEDTAYTRGALEPHNDGTYFTEAPGLQIFHCLGRASNSSGGETLLVDGMAAVNLLQCDDPEAYNILSSVATEAEYREEGRYYVTNQPIIITDPFTKNVLQIRFNLYDRSPMRSILNLENVRPYYIALCKLSNIILSEKFRLKMMLLPGTVLVIDNWRILHGRAAFSGHRHMSGCYIARSDWINMARVCGLLH